MDLQHAEEEKKEAPQIQEIHKKSGKVNSQMTKISTASLKTLQLIMSLEGFKYKYPLKTGASPNAAL